jgi:hypothetical protein
MLSFSGFSYQRQKGNQTHEKQITRKSAGQLGE